MNLHPYGRRRGLLGIAVTLAVLALVGGPAALAVPSEGRDIQRPKPIAGANAGTAGIKTFASQEAVARTAPYGSVAPGEYSDALGALRSLRDNGSRWQEVTDLPYDADDPGYRDPEQSNSGGGARFVAGRITGLAVGNGLVFAAGANGGVFRKPVGTSAWVPISDRILSLSSGDLVYDERADVLWYATGEANTGATSYTGAGVYRLRQASTSAGFTDEDRVGGDELESRSINQLKLDGSGRIYAATTRGLWRHAVAESRHGTAWQLVFMPNPASDSDISRPYDNIVNDLTVQPGTNGQVLLANAAWRSGADYNGFYLSTAGGRPGSFGEVRLQGDIDPDDVGNAELSWSADGSRLAMVLESPAKLLAGEASVLGGVYVSRGVTGPWTRVATALDLYRSGSVLDDPRSGSYAPGVQAWYNNFVEFDPRDADHIYVGLEEVFETTDGGRTWSTPGPYWNFGEPCFDRGAPDGGCPMTTHPDQHSVAIDDGTLWVGNDGGVYSRPLDPARSEENARGHATDWANHNVGLHTLQYYSVGVGRDPNGEGFAVAGGLQDNGGSLLRAGARELVSPFGGDGGDIIVNPRQGCQILDEYVFLVLWLTKTCGSTVTSGNPVFDVTVPDVNARFTAPFRAVRGSVNTRDGQSERWVAGGNSVWAHDLAFAYTRAEAEDPADPQDDLDENGWRRLHTLDGTGARVVVGLDAVASPEAPADASKDVVYAAWCGESNCNSAGFTRGVATSWGGRWTELDMRGLPNRFPSNVAIDRADPTGATIYLVFNGFNRRFIEGPGAGTKHVFRGTLSSVAGEVRVAWEDLSTGFPDVPATDVLVVGDALVVSTDLGVVLAPDKNAAPERMRWHRVGGNPGARAALPLSAVFDIHAGPDGWLYAATHGRGIWRTRLSGL